jgi:hypothetical protein
MCGASLTTGRRSQCTRLQAQWRGEDTTCGPSIQRAVSSPVFPSPPRHRFAGTQESGTVVSSKLGLRPIWRRPTWC